jgi:dinuclear metal center YbgI/SA1388 family protein
MLLADVLTVLDELAPLRYAESWDNVGLLVGDPAAEITKVLVTVDYTADVAMEAVAGGASLVVAYHPPIFAAVKRVPHHALWADALRRGIALYSPHTALDVARDGTNDFLADACRVDIPSRLALRPFSSGASSSESRSGAGGGRAEPGGIGLGRVGNAPVMQRSELVTHLKRELELAYVLVAGPLDVPVTRIAVAAGAGGELLEDAVRAGAEVFVTGEVRHHDALAAARRGVTVIATLHSNSERAAVRAYAARLGARLEGVPVTTSLADADPFVVV